MDVAYLTMAYDLKMTSSLAIPNCADQKCSYGKVLYIMYQEPFPVHIGDNHDLPITIREFDVEHQGSGWWLMKLKKFLDVCTEKYFVWWDEDDYKPHDYTDKALMPVNMANPLSWNLYNYEVKRGSIYYREYTSGMGTLAGYVGALRKPVAELLDKWPDGRIRINEQRQPVDASYNGQWSYGAGALDAYLKRILKKRVAMSGHTGKRFMTFHSKTNTRGGRKPEENVDYATV